MNKGTMKKFYAFMGVLFLLSGCSKHVPQDHESWKRKWPESIESAQKGRLHMYESFDETEIYLKYQTVTVGIVKLYGDFVTRYMAGKGAQRNDCICLIQFDPEIHTAFIAEALTLSLRGDIALYGCTNVYLDIHPEMLELQRDVLISLLRNKYGPGIQPIKNHLLIE